MIGMALRENDMPQRPGPVWRKQRLVAFTVADEAGIDQQIAVSGGHQIGVRDVLHHEDGIGNGLCRGLPGAGRYQIGERGLAHWPVSPKRIMTLAESGVAAIFKPSSTAANGKVWLIIAAILSRRRGIAAITSGNSTG